MYRSHSRIRESPQKTLKTIAVDTKSTRLFTCSRVKGGKIRVSEADRREFSGLRDCVVLRRWLPIRLLSDYGTDESSLVIVHYSLVVSVVNYTGGKQTYERSCHHEPAGS
jgi:hypothetical protein